jgi:tape measure domain-containing protein
MVIHLGLDSKGLTTGAKQAEGTLSALAARAASFGSSFSGLLGGVSFAGLAGWGIKLAAEAETAQVAFEVMLGSASRATSMISELKAFSASTPFEFTDLQDATKTLLAFGISGESILPTLQMLGDVAGGNSQKLQSLALVFGQIASSGKLAGGDLLQLINVGFNPLQIIAEKTGKSMSQLRDEMSDGLITFDMVREAFKTATSEGGLFFGMMDKMSKTLGAER